MGVVVVITLITITAVYFSRKLKLRPDLSVLFFLCDPVLLVGLQCENSPKQCVTLKRKTQSSRCPIRSYRACEKQYLMNGFDWLLPCFGEFLFIIYLLLCFAS